MKKLSVVSLIFGFAVGVITSLSFTLAPGCEIKVTSLFDERTGVNFTAYTTPPPAKIPGIQLYMQDAKAMENLNKIIDRLFVNLNSKNDLISVMSFCPIVKHKIMNGCDAQYELSELTLTVSGYNAHDLIILNPGPVPSNVTNVEYIITLDPVNVPTSKTFQGLDNKNKVLVLNKASAMIPSSCTICLLVNPIYFKDFSLNSNQLLPESKVEVLMKFRNSMNPEDIRLVKSSPVVFRYPRQ